MTPMTLIKWAAFAILATFVNIWSVLLSPILAAVSVMFNLKTLPGFLSWFHTHDDTLDGGQRQQPKLYPSGVKGVALWRQRMRWICRNPGYGFAANVCGIPYEGTSTIISGNLLSGQHVSFYRQGKKVGWGYRRNLVYGGGKKYMKIWFGWRIPTNDKKTYMIKFMFNPFLTVSW